MARSARSTTRRTPPRKPPSKPPRKPNARPAAKARNSGARGAPPEPAVWIYGRHAVGAALANGARALRRLLVTQAGFERLETDGAPAGLLAKAALCEAREIDRVLPDGAAHQGAALEADPLPRARLKETCADPAPRAPVLVLDQITDPQNIGAIFRSAAAFGARAVVTQERRTPPLAGALAKAAAGAIEKTPWIGVVNIARALEALDELGYHCAALAGDADAAIDALPTDRPVALVLGAEGAGLRPLVRRTCNAAYRIPIAPGMESLNVSNAAAVALYAAVVRTS